MPDVANPSPWRASYGTRPADLVLPGSDMLGVARRTLAATGERPLLQYFDTPVSGTALAEASDALAAGLHARGFRPGDRLVAQLQNIPQFVIALLGTWKAGGIFVTANPMYREREIAVILRDCGARAFLTLEELHPIVGAAAANVDLVLTTSPLEHLDGPPPAVLAGTERSRPAGTEDLAALIDAHRGHAVPALPDPAADDVAVLVYTSGTTGPPKGAMVTHRNLLADAALWPLWLDLTAEDVIMGIAPFFHITGLAANVCLSLLGGGRLVLGCRFDAAATLALLERHRATFVVGAITAYTALMNDPAFAATDLSALRVTTSGGAPVAPAIAERWEALTGVALQNCYGLTETTALVLLAPLGAPARTDPGSGALSVGIPVSSTHVEIQGDDGAPLAPGEIGEIVIAGPQVVPGYWEKPEETAHALPDGRLRTGDVGFMDADGWFYLVDRRKDLIVASGYKVWPREVEDVLAEHDAVREAAVVGVPDAYRGETVKAYVSLRAGRSATEAELVAFCRERMAAYKYPRMVEILDELPKTPSGKILRRELRDRG
jgi:long-chain acyl-CoA synthetase